MYYHNTLIFLGLFIYSVLMFHQDDYDTDLEYVKVGYYNPKYLKSVAIVNIKPNRTYKALSGHAEFLKDIVNTFKLNIKAHKIVDNVPKILMSQFDVPICETLGKNTFGINELRLLYSNITKCPIKKGFYIFKNFNIIASKLPPFVPSGRYLMNLSVFDKEIFVGNLVAYGSIIYRV